MRYVRGTVWCVLLAVPFGFVGAIGALELKRPAATPVASELSEASLHAGILDYVAEKNPHARPSAFREFPAVLLAESARTNIDHCLALAQAAAESDFRPDAVGSAGEIGIFQMLPSTAALLEPVVGKFKRPTFRRYERDLGDLADPLVSTRFAMAYLRDILQRRPSVRDALTEYNGGPRGRQPHYYRTVMAAYVETLERPALRCRLRETPKQPLGPPKPALVVFVPELLRRP